MENKAAALIVATSWELESHGSPVSTRRIIDSFISKRKEFSKISKFYFTVLDVEVSDDLRKDAGKVNVTLITATRNDLLSHSEDPPEVNWLFYIDIHYPQLKTLQGIKHVIGYSPKTQKAAAAIQQKLFPKAMLHQLPAGDGALFIYDEWDENACGLTAYHRSIIQELTERKNKTGVHQKIYSTILDVEVSDQLKADADSCHITLIPAQRKDRVDPEDDEPELKWLLNHEIYFPDLKMLENIKHVIGYAPKTAQAAADIREKLFSDAELVLINHAYEDPNCMWQADGDKFGEKMLKLAREADMIFSIGPRMHEHFENQYRAIVDGKKLSIIPHKEIIPKPRKAFFDEDPFVQAEVLTPNILTYGQLDTQEALEKCATLAAAIGSVANDRKVFRTNPPKWKILEVSAEAGEAEVNFLTQKLNSPHVQPKLQPGCSAITLRTALHQSHICLPAPSYKDYGFSGLESIALGIPTVPSENSELEHLMKKYFKDQARTFMVRDNEMSKKIIEIVSDNTVAFNQAATLKKAFMGHSDIHASYATFASILTSKGRIAKAERPEQFSRSFDESCDTAIQLKIKLDEETFKQHQQTEIQNGTDDALQNKLKTAWKKCSGAFKKRIKELINKDDEFKRVQDIISDNLGDVEPTRPTTGCLQVTLKIPRLLDHYRLEASCKSMSLAEALEPILITAEMREEAVAAGIPLKLNTTYDQARFNELELFFLNRDGAGIKPMNISDDGIQDDSVENMQDRGEKTDPNMSETGTSQKGDTDGRKIYRSKESPTIVSEDGNKLAREQGDTVPLKETADVPTVKWSDTQDVDIRGRQKSRKLTAVEHGKMVTSSGDVTNIDETFNGKYVCDVSTVEGECENGARYLHLPSSSIGPQTELSIALMSSMVCGMLVFILVAAIVIYCIKKRRTGANKDQDKISNPDHFIEKKENVVEVQPKQVKQDLDESLKEYSEVKRGLVEISKVKGKVEVVYTINDAHENVTERDKSAEELCPKPNLKQEIISEAAIAELAGAKSKIQQLEEENLNLRTKITNESMVSQKEEIECLKCELDKARANVENTELQTIRKTLEDELVVVEQIESALEKLWEEPCLKRESAEKIIDTVQVEDTKIKLFLLEQKIEEALTNNSKFHTDLESKSEMSKTVEEELSHLEKQCSDHKKKLENGKKDIEFLKTRLSKVQSENTERENYEIVRRDRAMVQIKDMLSNVMEEKSGTTLRKQLEEIHKLARDFTVKNVTWTKRIKLDGPLKQEMLFNNPTGLVFHDDKLLVCDKDNNVVRILKKDYTCEKELSFEGRFPKPFQPQSVAISQGKLYFILDSNNVQVVVCDQDGKMLRMFPLTKNVQPWCIAVSKGFVFITDVRGYRVLKYTQEGHHVAEVGGSGDEEIQFGWPGFVAINSKDVIMVSDWSHHCIKRFDIELNYLGQYGQYGIGDGQLKYIYSISVDDDDNVYVSDLGNGRIVKWSSDGKWLDNLFQREWIVPFYMAASATGDRIAVRGLYGSDIRVFSL